MAERSSAGDPRTDGLKPLGMSILVPLALLPSTLATGGLATVVVAASVGLVVGVPAVRALRSPTDGRRNPNSELLDAVTDLTVIAVLAGVGAALLSPLPGLLGAAVGLVGWLGAAWLAERDWRVRAGFGGAGAATALVAGGAALTTGPLPVTALTPQWSQLGAEAAIPVVAGLWIAGLGGGQWADARRPGTSRAPWTTAGLALLAVLGGVVWMAARYEVQRTLPGPDPVLGTALGLGWLSAASTWLTRKPAPLRWVAGGAGSTAWLAGPAAPLLPVLATTVLPLLVALALGLSAVSLRQSERVVVLLAAGVGLFAVVAGLGSVGLDAMGDAVVLAATVVAAFWFVATSLVRRREATA